jgi:lipopolysaccharide transport system ATP-binding protein
MTEIVIRAEGLGKRYLIGHQAGRERHATFRDVLVRSSQGLARSAKAVLGGRPYVGGDRIEEYWALRDLSFEIARGDIVGVIGRNGAGKSTLLKILSRITEPTEGRVEIKGRVASLLEVGTGFHPELTGRENVFLNGAILGMGRAEIKRKFDEIAAFAEVEKFLDTPVKRYSSGMYVRLAFAVAAHLEPEILIVDEVLAVGDAEFQKKCLGKMQDVAAHGRTVLFVSHNMAAIQKLCASALLLRGSSPAVRYESAGDAIRAYLYSGGALSGRWEGGDHFPDNPYFRPGSLAVAQENGASGVRDVTVEVRGTVLEPHSAFHLGLGFFNHERTLLYVTSNTDRATGLRQKIEPGPIAFSVRLPAQDLNEGTYFVALAAHLKGREVLFDFDSGPQVSFEVARDFTLSPFWDGRRPGILAPELCWERISPQALAA